MGTPQRVASLKDIPAGKATSVVLGGKTIGLFNIQGKIFAVDNECTHAGEPLCEGELNGTTITCPWHGASFNLTNGEVLEAPASDNLNCYKVTVDGDDVKIET